MEKLEKIEQRKQLVHYLGRSDVAQPKDERTDNGQSKKRKK